MKTKRKPGSAGTHTGQRTKRKEYDSMLSKAQYNTWPTRRQWRTFVVGCIEGLIGFGVVAGTIFLASVLLKACGVI